MKTINLAVSGCRSAFVKIALCLLPLMLVSVPASAVSLSIGSISNPKIAGGTLMGISGAGLNGTTLGFNLTLGNIGAPAQVFLAAYVPTGTLGLTADTWFCYTPNGWQPLVGASYVPFMTGVAAGTTLRLSLLENVDLNSLPKAEVYVGYGTSVDEMIQSARYKGVVAIR